MLLLCNRRIIIFVFNQIPLRPPIRFQRSPSGNNFSISNSSSLPLFLTSLFMLIVIIILIKFRFLLVQRCMNPSFSVCKFLHLSFFGFGNGGLHRPHSILCPISLLITLLFFNPTHKKFTIDSKPFLLFLLIFS